MGSEIIYYDLKQIPEKGNEFKILSFAGGQNILINHFTRKDGSQDYIVIGRVDMDKFKNTPRVDLKFQVLSPKWISALNDYIEGYRRVTLYLMTSIDKLFSTINVTERDINDKKVSIIEGNRKYQRRQTTYASEELKNNRFFSWIDFSPEGYDFITGKFLFTKGIMKRNVTIPIDSKDDEILFSNKYRVLCSGTCFLPYDYYAKQFPLTPEEAQNMDESEKIKFYNFNFYQFQEFFFESRKRYNTEIYKDDEYIKYNQMSQVAKLQFLIEFAEDKFLKTKGSTIK